MFSPFLFIFNCVLTINFTTTINMFQLKTKNIACDILSTECVPSRNYFLFSRVCIPSGTFIYVIRNYGEFSYYIKKDIPKKIRYAQSFEKLKHAGDRNRTGTVLPQQDFKSCASASSATPAFITS